MAMRIRKIVTGKMVGGKFVPNRKGTIRNPAKLGSGALFEKCVADVTARGGAVDPRAVCAGAGRKKYGKKRFQTLALKGKRRAAKRRAR